MAWLARPVLRMLLNRSVRTRVLIVCGDEVVLLKGWLGKSRWSLPGGGIAKNEDKVACAIRETYEEVGIKINFTQLNHMARLPYIGPDPKAKFPIEYFFVKLDKKSPIKVKRPWEIIEAEWFSLHKLPKQLSQTTQAAIKLARQNSLLT